MEIAKLEAAPRQVGGTRAARRLRRVGKLPGIVYGHQEAAETVIVDAHELGLLLEHGAHLVELQMSDKAQPALIKDVQYAYLGTDPVHVDFVRVARDERVTVKVPLEFKGTPVGINEGGLLDMELVDLEVECLATEIPDSIRVNVAALKIGDSIHVKDLELPGSVTAASAPEAIVCAVRAKKEEVEAAPVAEGEAAAEPEIITRKKEEAEPAEGEK
jgi:large subunit ribosomal protein L25